MDVWLCAILLHVFIHGFARMMIYSSDGCVRTCVCFDICFNYISFFIIVYTGKWHHVESCELSLSRMISNTVWLKSGINEFHSLNESHVWAHSHVISHMISDQKLCLRCITCHKYIPLNLRSITLNRRILSLLLICQLFSIFFRTTYSALY